MAEKTVSYERPQLNWVENVVFYRLLGVVKIKPQGGKVRLGFQPLPAVTILFFRSSQPVALAKLKPGVTVVPGGTLYEVEYYDVKWLTTKEPK